MRGAGLRARARGAHRVRGSAGSGGGCNRRADRRRRARARATPRCSNTRAKFDGVAASLGGRARNPGGDEMRHAYEALPERSARRCEPPPRASARFTSGRSSRPGPIATPDGSEFGQRVTRARPRRHLRAGRQGRVSVVGADERDPGARRRRRRDRDGGSRRPAERAIRWCSPPRILPASRARSRSAARRRSRRSLTARRRSPPVDKICGPGNAYVAAAKRRVFGAVGIDMIAGVSEVLVIADGSANADWVAMDLFAQAEHDELAQAILVTPDAALLDAVAASAERQLGADAAARDHRGIARQSRRAHQGARPRRSVRRREPRRARASGARGRRSRGACCRRSAMPARSSWGIMRRKRSATTARDRTTCCRPAAPRAFRRRSASTISRSARACSISRLRRRARWAPWPPRSRTAKACAAHAQSALLSRATRA